VDPRPRKLLLVDVPPDRAAACLRAFEDAGWTVQAETAEGVEELTAALLRRGWDAVLHGGDDAASVPATKAFALVRLADAYLPVITVDPSVRLDDVSAVIGGAVRSFAIAGPEHVPELLRHELEAAARRRGTGGAHRLLAAQQGVADHLAAGPEPHQLLRRVLATLGETLGWCYGAVWRPAPDGAELRCLTTWHVADPRVAGFASLSRSWTFAPGNGLPGRVWAFRRPLWMADVAREGMVARGPFAARAGLVAATAFPVTAGDGTLAVAELWAPERLEPDPEASALFAAVGRQVGSALSRWEREEAARRRLELLLTAAAGSGVPAA
jgi:hypothetical protein